MFFNMIWLYL